MLKSRRRRKEQRDEMNVRSLMWSPEEKAEERGENGGTQKHLDLRGQCRAVFEIDSVKPSHRLINIDTSDTL